MTPLGFDLVTRCREYFPSYLQMARDLEVDYSLLLGWASGEVELKELEIQGLARILEAGNKLRDQGLSLETIYSLFTELAAELFDSEQALETLTESLIATNKLQ